MKKKVNIFLFICLLFLFNGCLSSRQKNLQPIDQNDEIIPIVQQMKRKCYVQGKTGFLLQLTSLSDGFSLQLEGAWRHDFHNLILQVVGPLGEDYGGFELAENKIASRYFNVKGGQAKQFDEVMSFISAIGSKHMRDLFCGTYPFESKSKIRKNLEDSVHYENEITWEVQSHTIDVENQWMFAASANNPERKNLIIRSQFSAKFLFSSSHIDVKWDGFVSPHVLIPRTLVVTLPKNKFSLSFSDFN